MSLLCSTTRRRAAQARALVALDDLLTGPARRLPDLRWTIEPHGDLTGSVPPQATEEEILQVFNTWTGWLHAERNAAVTTDDRTMLHAVKAGYGDQLVYLSVRATIPHQLREPVTL